MLPLRLTPSEWHKLLRWFVLGQSAAVIAQEACLGSASESCSPCSWCVGPWPKTFLPPSRAPQISTRPTWATTGFNKLLLFGADPGDVVPEMVALAGFAIAFGIVAAWRFRARVT